MTKSKHQVIFIRGAETFDNNKQFYSFLKKRQLDSNKPRKGWRDWIIKRISRKFESFVPNMPNRDFADYHAWKIWFERQMPLIKKSKKIKLILVGNSLGSSFLLKYLSENKFPKHINQIHLVCPAIDDNAQTGDTMGNFRPNLKKLKNLEAQTDFLSIYHSRDDPIVPFKQSQKLMKHLEKGRIFEFENRGHFFQPTFKELLQNIYDQFAQK